MSSTPSSVSFKEHNVSNLPTLLSNIVSASVESVPTETDIERLRKEVDDFYAATRKLANRYQQNLESLVSRHGTADQARRRDVQKSTAATAAAAAAAAAAASVSTARQEEGIYCFRDHRDMEMLMNRIRVR
jgi:pyruvate/2-oxoglutarate dehydrogenase complex dihydrolipoamide acyltransferase (E2) component